MKSLICTLALSALFCSCESKGPKSRYYEDTRTSDEMLEDIKDAHDGAGWLHTYDTDVFYLVDGEWTCYGKVSVFKNLEDGKGRKWVEFDGLKYAAEDADKGGYSYKVQYNGEWYYF